ncbi:hypothetical protein [Arthrobacter livingstonensis]|uniref:hypothetical protein n=1 Tax=Arthrobacter livingstonensis TaxID=670078 RepID=UPI0011B37A2A|nr:hypothetical protein [Arthrobacter livingstonensis]
MIAHLPNGRVGTRHESSRGILPRNFGLPRLTDAKSPGAMNFDGGLGLSVGRRGSLPVVLFPAFREYGTALQPAADAIYQLQQASLEFRVVAATDMAVFKSLRPFGWAIAHIREEDSWVTPRQSWTQYVHAELAEVKTDFGVSLIVDLSEQGVSEASWLELVSVSRIATSIPNPTSISGLSSYHHSWRGWLGSIADGKSSHTVNTAAGEWHFDIEKSPNSSMVFIGSSTIEDQELAKAATNRGWNVATFSPPSGTLQPRGIRQAVTALLDGLSLDGGGMVVSRTYPKPEALASCSATVFSCSPSIGDLETAERRALAFWSSRGSGDKN